MNILTTILIGFVVGLLARVVMPGRDRMGIILTTLLGIAGAFVGNFVGQTMGWATPNHPAGFFASVMGALLILYLLSWVMRDKVTT